ncbi:MAG: DMT family transporter [Gloeomargarita sp. SZTDM-1c_bins_89]
MIFTAMLRLLGLVSPFFFWGTAMIVMKALLPETGPWFVGAFRLIPAGVLVLTAALVLGRPQPRTWLAWLGILLFALVDGALFQGFLVTGLARTQAGLGSVMIDSQPLAVALLAWLLYGEVIGLWGWIGLVLGVTGIALIALSPQEWLQGVNWWGHGEWWMLLAALAMAVGTVMMRWLSRWADPLVATGWHMVLGGVPLLVLSVMQEGPVWQHLTGWDWLGLAYTTVLGSAASYGLFFYLAAKGNLTSLSALTFLTPVFALTFGALFLGEQLTTWQWVGVILTLVSITLINQRHRLQPTPVAEPVPVPVSVESRP